MEKNQDKSATRKSTYTSPRLETFGPLQGLTLGSGGNMGDGNLGMTRGDGGMDMTKKKKKDQTP